MHDNRRKAQSAAAEEGTDPGGTGGPLRTQHSLLTQRVVKMQTDIEHSKEG